MSNLLGGLGGLGGLGNLNNLSNLGNNNMLNSLNGEGLNKINIKNIAKLDNFADFDNAETPEVSGLTQDKNALSEDKEFVADLKSLLEKNKATNGIFDSDQLGADDAARTFSKVFENYINDANSTQMKAERAIETFASGGNIDVHTVMIASEKANLSMQMTMQMRNKILQAYQEISRMQV
ncbi:MAG: flagellar hook-basal body complex protein FliE [bacterium]